jgi:hypothetical protein
VYSDLTSFVRQYPHLDQSSRCKLLSLLSKALLTLSLWTNTPLGSHGESNDVEDDEELRNPRPQMLDSWISFLQLSCQVITMDTSSGQLVGVEQWEESALEHTTQRILPFLLETYFDPNRDEETSDLVAECLSTCFEFLTGTLSSAKILYRQEALMTRTDSTLQRGLWSIFGSLDRVMNLLLSSIHDMMIPSLSTSNFQDFLLASAASSPLQLLPSLQAITSSLQTSEILFYFNLAEAVGSFLEGHLVGFPHFSFPLFVVEL